MLQQGGAGARSSSAEWEERRVQPRGRDGRFVAEPWMEKFLKELEASGLNVLMSAELAGVRREWAYMCRARNPEFRSQWNQVEAKVRALHIPRRTRPRAA